MFSLRTSQWVTKILRKTWLESGKSFEHLRNDCQVPYPDNAKLRLYRRW